jgi:NADPH:quinone reductase-like Zn-dependent oxidoreductase
MQEQHNILDEIARQINAGVLCATVSENNRRIVAENLRLGHAMLESGKAKGKIVLERF